MTEESLYQKIFASHFGHLAVIFLWTSGNLFQLLGKVTLNKWVVNPLKLNQLHTQSGIHTLVNQQLKAFTRGGASYPVNIAYSGVYHWWYTIGMRNK